MSFSCGDIVLVDYPFSDRTGSKVRPALVVRADSLNHRIADTIVAAITRSTHRALPITHSAGGVVSVPGKGGESEKSFSISSRRFTSAIPIVR